MKKIALCILLVCVTSPLFAVFEFSGQAIADVAFQYSRYNARQEDDKKEYKKIGAPYEDTALEFSAKVKEGKLTSEWTLRINSTSPQVENGWVAYDFGLTTLKYSAVGICHRWHEDMLFFDAAEGNAFDMTIADIVYFSVIGLASETNGALQDIDNRMVPVMSLGFDVKFSLFSIAIGGVWDQNPASKNEKAFTEDTDYDGIPDSSQMQKEGYTGYMGFVNAKFDMNPIEVTGAFCYGRSIGFVTGAEELQGKDSIGLGTLATVAFSMGQTQIGNTFYWTHVQKAGNNDNRTVVGFTPVDAFVCYNYDNNLYVKPYVTYNKYTKQSNDADSYDEIIGAVQMGFSW